MIWLLEKINFQILLKICKLILEATKGQLDFQHTQELEKLAKSYQQDLLTTRDNMAMVG